MNASRAIARVAVLLASFGGLGPAGDCSGSRANAEEPPLRTNDPESKEPEIGPIDSLARWIGAPIQTSDGLRRWKATDALLDLEDGRVAMLLAEPGDSKPGTELRSAWIPWDKVVALPGGAKGAGDAIEVRLSDAMLDKSAVSGADFKLSRGWWHKIIATLDPEMIAAEPRPTKTLAGKIISVSESRPRPALAPGFELVVSTAGGESNVHLGPSWYLTEQGVKLAAGQQATVEAVETQLPGGRMRLDAVSLACDGRQVPLRRADGSPRWPSWNQRAADYELTRWSKLKNTMVKGTGDEELGSIVGLAVVVPSGQIAYAAMAAKDLPPGQLRPIPLAAFLAPPGQDHWSLEMPENIIKNTATFARGAWPRAIDQGWIEYVHVRYGREPLEGVRIDRHEAGAGAR